MCLTDGSAVLTFGMLMNIAMNQGTILLGNFDLSSDIPIIIKIHQIILFRCIYVRVVPKNLFIQIVSQPVTWSLGVMWQDKVSMIQTCGDSCF